VYHNSASAKAFSSFDSNFSVFIGVILFIIIAVNICRLYRFTSKSEIKSRIEGLGQNLDNQNVKEFITFIKTDSIPNKPEVWNSLRAGCKLACQDRNIDIELKKELRHVLLSRGVNV